MLLLFFVVYYVPITSKLREVEHVNNIYIFGILFLIFFNAHSSYNSFNYCFIVNSIQFSHFFFLKASNHLVYLFTPCFFKGFRILRKNKWNKIFHLICTCIHSIWLVFFSSCFFFFIFFFRLLFLDD